MAHMPKYYFHVHDGRSEIDTDGVILQDQAAANVLAMTLVGEIFKGEAKKLAATHMWSMDVADDAGNILYRIDMRVSQPYGTAHDSETTT